MYKNLRLELWRRALNDATVTFELEPKIYGYGYEDCRGHPGAPPIRYYAHSTLSGSIVGRKTLSCIERGLLLTPSGQFGSLADCLR